MQKTFSRMHTVLATVIAIGVWGQMSLAGVWHAGVVSTPELHVFFGLGLLAASLLALIAAVVGGMGRRVIGLTAVLFILILLQPILIEQRRAGIPVLSAFHTLNAAFIGMTAGLVIAASRQAAHRETTPAETIPAPAGD